MKDSECRSYIHTYKCNESDCTDCPERFGTDREIKIGESAAELMLLYFDLANEGKVPSIMSDDVNSCELLNSISNFAVEFEFKYEDTDDWLNDIDRFGTQKLLQRYGNNKTD